MPVMVVFTLFLLTLTGSSNAINLTDGLDGLAIGCTVTVALTYGIMSYASGNFLISEYLRISWVPGTGELTVVCASFTWGKFGFFMVQRSPSRNIYGGHGIASNRWFSWNHSIDDSSTFHTNNSWRNLCNGSWFCNIAGSLIQKSWEKNFFNVTDSSSFRIERMERNKGSNSFLDFIFNFCTGWVGNPKVEIV